MDQKPCIDDVAAENFDPDLSIHYIRRGSMDGDVYCLQSEDLITIQKGLENIENVAAKERIRAATLQAQSTQLALSRMDYERKLKE